MPPLTRATRDRSNRWQLALLAGLVLAAFGGFFAVGRAGGDDTSVEPSGEQSAAGTDHQISLPDVRLTGSGNLPQLAAVSEPPKEEKPKPTPPPPPAEQTTAPAEPAEPAPEDEAVPAAPVTTPTPTPAPAPAPTPAPTPSSSSGSSDGSNQPPVSFDDSG